MTRRRSRTRQTALPESNPLLRREMPLLRAPTLPMLTGASKKQYSDLNRSAKNINFSFCAVPKRFLKKCLFSSYNFLQTQGA